MLYEEFEWAVLEFPSPLLLLGNDPVLFWSLSRKRASGSFSQIADEDKDDPFLSTWTDDLTAIGDRAVEVVRDRDLVLFPLDPRRLLVLSRFAGMFSPGVHHVRPEMARVANLLMLVASAD